MPFLGRSLHALRQKLEIRRSLLPRHDGVFQGSGSRWSSGHGHYRRVPFVLNGGAEKDPGDGAETQGRAHFYDLLDGHAQFSRNDRAVAARRGERSRWVADHSSVLFQEAAASRLDEILLADFRS